MFEVRDNAEQVDVLVYDYIGSYDGEISAKQIKDALDKANGRPVNLHIDSGGGDVFEAFAMCSNIQRYEGKVTAYVEGLAASAASYLAVVCDEVIMNDYAYLMIHRASAIAWGNALVMEDTAERLRNIDKTLAGIYEKRSGLTLDEVLAYMDAETWFTAAEALEVGLATEVVETEQRIAARIDREHARHYNHIPEGIAIGDATEQAPEVENLEAESHAPETMENDGAVKEAARVFTMDGHIYQGKDNRHEL